MFARNLIYGIFGHGKSATNIFNSGFRSKPGLRLDAAFAADDIEGICDLRDLREMPGKLSRLVELALPHAAPMK
jgi:hypothetical protein|tara:strand:- start:241 stop:462 length:222 start_codon:yes stop_codon:yes gene_type:complete